MSPLYKGVSAYRSVGCRLNSHCNHYSYMLKESFTYFSYTIINFFDHLLILKVVSLFEMHWLKVVLPRLAFISGRIALIFQNRFAFTIFFRNFCFAEVTVSRKWERKSGFSFAFRSTFRNFALLRARTYSVSTKKETSFFVLCSTFCNFVRIRSISLNKGSLGNWGETGLRIGDRSQFFILL